MSYADTARAFAAAEYGNAISGKHDALRMSEWAESRRRAMSAQTIAHNHAFHVSDVASDLRAMLETPETTENHAERARWIEHNARALLRAIGENGRTLSQEAEAFRTLPDAAYADAMNGRN